MPYINADARARLEKGGKPETPGELNYLLTKLVDAYLLDKNGITYSSINEVLGALECAKLEVYRRVAAPYEDKKIEENGDVYTYNLYTYNQDPLPATWSAWPFPLFPEDNVAPATVAPAPIQVRDNTLPAGKWLCVRHGTYPANTDCPGCTHG